MSGIRSSNRGFSSNRSKDYTKLPSFGTTKLLLPTSILSNYSNQSMRFCGGANPGYINGFGSQSDTQPINKDFTVECWVKLISYGTGNVTSVISCRSTTGGWMLYIGGATSGVQGKLVFNANGGAQSIGTTVMALNTWYHIAATYQNGASNTSVVNLYVNGSLDKTSTGINNLTAPSPALDTTIGHETSTASFALCGYLDEFRIWRTARSATDIANNYKKVMVGNETNLAVNFRFEETNTTKPINTVTNIPASVTNAFFSYERPTLDDTIAINNQLATVNSETYATYIEAIAKGYNLTLRSLVNGDILVKKFVTQTGISFSTLQFETRLFLLNVGHNGGTISNNTLLQVDTFVKALRSAGIISKMVDVGLFCGNNLGAAFTKIIYPLGYSPWMMNVNYAFKESDYSESQGIVGDGSSKFLDTCVAASALQNQNTSLSVYLRGTSIGGGNAFGPVNGSDPRILLTAPYVDNNCYCDIYNDSTGSGRVSGPVGTIGSVLGHFCGSRTSSSSNAVYRNGTVINSNTGSGGTFANLGNAPLPAVGSYNTNSHTSGSSPTLPTVFYHWGTGLTSTEVTALYNAVVAFQTSLGRNF